MLTFGLTVGLTTEVGDVVFVVGVVVVLFVIVGFAVVVVVFVAGVVVLDVSVGLVVKGTLGASVVFGTLLVFVVKDAGGFVGNAGLVVGLVTVDMTGGSVTPPLVVAPVVRLGR